MDVASVRRVHQEDWTDEGVRFLRARDLVAFAKNEPVDDPLFISEEMYQEYSAQSGKVSMGDLLVTGVGTIGVPWLVTSENPIYFKDGNIIWFKNAGEIDGEFFYHSFTASTIQNYINEAAGIGTVGTFTIETGKKTPIWLPTKQEQRCVSAFMTRLDNLITLHQRKHDQLAMLKKSLLDKMFPKPGSDVPELRFAGFTEPWEQRKLGEVAPLQRGFDLPFSQMSPGPYPVVMSNGIGGWHSHYKVKGPGVVTGRSGTIGCLQYIEDNYWPHNTSLWVTSFTGNYPRFIYWLYASVGLERFSSGSGVPTLNRNDVHDYAIALPRNLNEQLNIACLFTRLDNLITLHQREPLLNC